EGLVAGQQVVGADKGRVAPDIARAEPALLDNGDIADAMFPGEIVGGGEAVAAATDDDDIVMALRFRLPPDRLPVAVARKGVGDERRKRIAHEPDPSTAANMRDGAADPC